MWRCLRSLEPSFFEISQWANQQPCGNRNPRECSIFVLSIWHTRTSGQSSRPNLSREPNGCPVQMVSNRVIIKPLVSVAFPRVFSRLEAVNHSCLGDLHDALRHLEGNMTVETSR